MKRDSGDRTCKCIGPVVAMARNWKKVHVHRALTSVCMVGSLCLGSENWGLLGIGG